MMNCMVVILGVFAVNLLKLLVRNSNLQYMNRHFTASHGVIYCSFHPKHGFEHLKQFVSCNSACGFHTALVGEGQADVIHQALEAVTYVAPSALDLKLELLHDYAVGETKGLRQLVADTKLD